MGILTQADFAHNTVQLRIIAFRPPEKNEYFIDRLGRVAKKLEHNTSKNATPRPILDRRIIK